MYLGLETATQFYQNQELTFPLHFMKFSPSIKNKVEAINTPNANYDQLMEQFSEEVGEVKKIVRIMNPRAHTIYEHPDFLHPCSLPQKPGGPHIVYEFRQHISPFGIHSLIVRVFLNKEKTLHWLNLHFYDNDDSPLQKNETLLSSPFFNICFNTLMYVKGMELKMITLAAHLEILKHLLKDSNSIQIIYDSYSMGMYEKGSDFHNRIQMISRKVNSSNIIATTIDDDGEPYDIELPSYIDQEALTYFISNHSQWLFGAKQQTISHEGGEESDSSSSPMIRWIGKLVLKVSMLEETVNMYKLAVKNHANDIQFLKKDMMDNQNKCKELWKLEQRKLKENCAHLKSQVIALNRANEKRKNESQLQNHISILESQLQQLKTDNMGLKFALSEKENECQSYCHQLEEEKKSTHQLRSANIQLSTKIQSIDTKIAHMISNRDKDIDRLNKEIDFLGNQLEEVKTKREKSSQLLQSSLSSSLPNDDEELSQKRKDPKESEKDIYEQIADRIFGPEEKKQPEEKPDDRSLPHCVIRLQESIKILVDNIQYKKDGKDEDENIVIGQMSLNKNQEKELKQSPSLSGEDNEIEEEMKIPINDEESKKFEILKKGFLDNILKYSSLRLMMIATFEKCIYLARDLSIVLAWARKLNPTEYSRKFGNHNVGLFPYEKTRIVECLIGNRELMKKRGGRDQFIYSDLKLDLSILLLDDAKSWFSVLFSTDGDLVNNLLLQKLKTIYNCKSVPYSITEPPINDLYRHSTHLVNQPKMFKFTKEAYLHYVNDYVLQLDLIVMKDLLQKGKVDENKVKI